MKHLKKHFIFEDLQLYKIEDFFQPLSDEGCEVNVYTDGIDKNIINVNIIGPTYKTYEFKLDEQEEILKNRVEKIIPILLQHKYNMFEIASSVRKSLNHTHGNTSSADYYKKYVTGVDDKLHLLSKDTISLTNRFRHDDNVPYEKYTFSILFNFRIKPLNYDRMLRNGAKK